METDLEQVGAESKNDTSRVLQGSEYLFFVSLVHSKQEKKIQTVTNLFVLVCIFFEECVYFSILE